MSQMNPKNFPTSLQSQFNHYTLPVTPLKGKLTHPNNAASVSFTKRAGRRNN